MPLPRNNRPSRAPRAAFAVLAAGGLLSFGAVSAAPAGAIVPTATTAGRLADSAGSATVGSASYAVPSGAIFVAPSGSDSNPGSQTRPVKTVARGLALAPAGGTVVLRKGVYHESVTISRKVVLQNYPGEYAWFDGAVPVTGWVKDGATWRKDGWTTRFDASVGYSKGDRDGTTPGWQWVNPAYPMASHPDQVQVGSANLRQVASKAKVGPGTFYLDEATSRLYVGSDPAAGARASTLTRAIRLTSAAAGSTVRGIGVRMYSPSIWHIGSVTVESPKTRFENVAITDSASIGIGVVVPDVTLSRVSVVRSGLLGVHAATADRLRVDRSRIDGNNVERFNDAPVSGGIKAGRTRLITVTSSSLSNNNGPGFWSDVSVYDTRVLGSNVTGNRGAGVFLEISAHGWIADDIIADNGGDGVKVNNTSSVAIWNNTIVRNGRALNLVQDPRRPSNTSYGDDYRYPNDREMTWLLGPVWVRNNVIGLPTSGANCVLCVEDYGHQRTAAQMGIASNNNVFTRASSRSTQWLTVWSRGSVNVNPAVYTTLPAHRTGTRQDTASLAYDSTQVTSGNVLSSGLKAAASSSALPLPASVAGMTGRPAGSRVFGAYGR